jgi:membrane-associated protease RseP (regulator of RpoE activity)
MDIVILALQLILSLSILVVLHEFGHFLPARLFKTRVEKFYLFFDPYFSLFKKKIGDTEWGIGWIPFGGYVKISGMIDESMDKDQRKADFNDISTTTSCFKSINEVWKPNNGSHLHPSSGNGQKGCQN